ncbi:Pyrimidine nucleotide transporter, mitochondrial [Polyrhizophydium stewartii]|uniref:Pyrimidine nucleotide transporter, mitochondrial n=1 Tax=Polyrhizophydium stewartii TaxID=2732419 RepID=A0ABR4NCQ6_9FUNG
MSKKPSKPAPSFWLHFMAGGIGGTVGAAVTCPLEVVKTRLQSSLYRAGETPVGTRNPLAAAWHHVRGVVGLLRTIQQKEGFRALWKGLGPNLIGVVPARAINFSVYSQCKYHYAAFNGGTENSVVHMFSAATASMTTSIVTNPIWLVKTRMQLQSEDPARRSLQRYRNSFHCAYMVVKEEGIRGLYRGLSASFLGMAEPTLQFVMYEYFKKSVLDRKRAAAERKGRSTEDVSLDWLQTFGVAAAAKLIAAVVAYPHEVIRTRMRQTPVAGQLKYTGLMQTASLILREEGPAALYGGMTAHLMRVVPNAAILFFCYETVIAVGARMAPPQKRA